MKVADLVRILLDFDQDATVDIAKRSEYPYTFNAERVLEDGLTVVIECDDD
jgi:hypothetical protein